MSFFQKINISLFTLVFLPIQAFAIYVKLPVDNMVLGSAMVTNIQVSNPSEEFKAVEVNIASRKHSINRKEILEESDHFIIIPPQSVLGPNQERSVTLKWAGPTKLDKELPYRIVVEEVLFKDEKNQNAEGTSAKVNIRLRFVNSFYVKPKHVNPDIIAESLTPTKDNQFFLVLKNKGTEHLIVNTFDLDIKDKNKIVQTLAVDPKLMNGSINLLAGESQGLLLKELKDLNDKSYSVVLKNLNKK